MRQHFVPAATTSGLPCYLQQNRPVQMDGQMNRIPVEGDKNKERSGAYVGHLDGPACRLHSELQDWRENELKGHVAGSDTRRAGPCPHGGGSRAEAA